MFSKTSPFLPLAVTQGGYISKTQVLWQIILQAPTAEEPSVHRVQQAEYTPPQRSANSGVKSPNPKLYFELEMGGQRQD